VAPCSGSKLEQTIKVGMSVRAESSPSTGIGQPLEALTGSPSANQARQSNKCRPARRLATLSGSTAEENAIIENCGTSRKPISSGPEPGCGLNMRIPTGARTSQWNYLRYF